ncbi:MAG: RNA 3'-terminal phosphate cyclase [Planctomycetota bacterium]|jgi:RNA 3'-terminal phosphate cyclase (ATP)
METVVIDGSTGEGGGQILRTSLALSCITGKSLHIEKIRAARPKPGLAKQHLSSVNAACQICNAKCDGAAPGSTVLDFKPGPIKGGDYRFDIGTAGSASLVIQTVLPPLFGADTPSTVAVTGGTHNPWAPPFDFLDETFLPAIAAAGFFAKCELIKHGFFPAGAGQMTMRIHPWRKRQSCVIDLCQPDDQPQPHARVYTAKLPPTIALRQKKLLKRSGLNIGKIEHVDATDSDGPGNCVMVRVCGPSRTTVFTAFGMPGKPSQKVIREVADLAGDFLAAGAAVDRFLADQLLIYMALAKSGDLTTNELSSHLLTNIQIIKKFLPVDFSIQQHTAPILRQNSRTEKKMQIHQVSCRPKGGSEKP